MEDRVKLNNGKSSKLRCPQDYNPSDFTTFLTHLKNGNVFVDVNQQTATTGTDAGLEFVGTPLNKANLLTDAVATKFGLTPLTDATINGALDVIADRFIDSDEVYYATFIGGQAGWGTSAPYTQTIQVSGLLASWPHPIYDLYIPDNTATATAALQADAFSLVNKMKITNGAVTLTCFANAPQVDFQIMIAKG